MALTDLTRISTSGIATGSTIDAAILRKDVSFRGSQVGITSALFDSSDDALEFNDNVKLKFGNSGDLELYHDTSNGSYIKEAGPGALRIQGDAGIWMQSTGNQDRITAENDAVNLFSGGTKRFNTTSTGAIVTGILTASKFSGSLVGNTSNASGISTFYDLRVSNNLTVEGTTTTLDTNLIGVDRVEVGADSNTVAGIAVTQSGTADIVRLYDGASQVLTVDDEGNVGVGINSPSTKLQVHGGLIKISGNAYARVTVNDGANEAFFGFDNQGPLLIGNANADAQIRVQGTNDIFFQTGNTVKRLTIKGDTGNVGIGTDNPATQLEIHGDSGGTIRLAKGGANRTSVLAGDTLGKIEFRSYDGSLNYSSYNGTYAEIETVVTNDLGGNPSEEVRLDFKIADSDEPGSGKPITPVPALSILQGGSVGIGSTIPLSAMALDVVGSIRYSNQSRGAGGSASQPSYAFYGDHDTGMYRGNGVNILSFATAGNERLKIDADGVTTHNAGVIVSGIITATQFTSVNGSNTGFFKDNQLTFNPTGDAFIDHRTNNKNIFFRLSKSSALDTNMVQIDSSAEQTKFRKIITVGLQGGNDTTQIGGGSGIGAYIQLNYANNSIVNTKLMGNNHSWLNSHYGNLGIGTQNPQAKFVVSNAGENGFEFNPNFSSNNSIIASYNRTGGGSYSQLTLSASQHIFAQGGTEYGRFDANGRLGIGTDNPGADLTVQSDSSNTNMAGHNYLASQSGIILQNRTISSGHFTAYTGNVRSSGGYTQSGSLAFESTGSGTAPKIHITQRTGGGVQTKRLTIATDGNVGINSTDPSTMLDVFKFTNTSASNTATTLLRLTNHVGTAGNTGDILSPNGQISFIDFRFLDANQNFTPQVRIGAQVGKTIGDSGTESEGFGSFVVYTGKGSGSAGSGSADERMKITPEGAVVIRHDGATGSDGHAGLEVRAAKDKFQMVLSSSSATASDNQVKLGFKLHPSGQDERIKGAIVVQGNGGGYGETDFMSFCLDTVADNGNTGQIYNDERVRISSTGFMGPIARTGSWQGTYVYRQQSQGQNYEHKIRGPKSGYIEDEMATNSVAYIKIQTLGTGTNDSYCEYVWSQDGESAGASLTHIRGNSGSNSNKPYMVLDGQYPTWKTAHSVAYNFLVRVEITGGDDGETYSSTGSYAAN